MQCTAGFTFCFVVGALGAPLIKLASISADSWSNMIRDDHTWSETWSYTIRHDQTWFEITVWDQPLQILIRLGRQTWPADLAGRLGWQTWLADLAGRLGWQTWLADLAGRLGQQTCPAYLAGSLPKTRHAENRLEETGLTCKVWLEVFSNNEQMQTFGLEFRHIILCYTWNSQVTRG
jgi:hypothetical protein